MEQEKVMAPKFKLQPHCALAADPGESHLLPLSLTLLSLLSKGIMASRLDSGVVERVGKCLMDPVPGEQ